MLTDDELCEAVSARVVVGFGDDPCCVQTSERVRSAAVGRRRSHTGRVRHSEVEVLVLQDECVQGLHNLRNGGRVIPAFDGWVNFDRVGAAYVDTHR